MKRKSTILTFIFILSLTLIFSTMILAAEYNEAPMLAERVNEGELPPVGERLPEEPFVVESGTLFNEEYVDWQIGEYGGKVTTVHNSAEWSPDIFIMANEPLVMVPGIQGTGVKPSIVENFEVSDDNKEFIFTLRKGLKWSDGFPVTTEDVRFAYEDVMLNEKISPMFPQAYRSGGKSSGEPMDLEIIDNYTFKITFEEPYGYFLTSMAIEGWRGYTDLLKPKHYLKNYHADYTPISEMQEDLEEEELEDEWWDLFDAKDITNWELTNERAVGFPSLYPWIRVESSGGLMAFERNPYYFKVDPEGNQLPYIDRLESTMVNDLEMATMKAISGEINLLSGLSRANKLPVYVENQEKGGYKVQMLKMHTVPSAIYLNYTYEDSTVKEIFNDIRFRKALTHSIDRKEIIDTLYFRQATIPDALPSEYNPAKVRELLDEMGMDERDDEGFRLGPDGEKFELFFEVYARRPDIVPATELFVEYFRDVGIRTNMKQISGELRTQKQGANELMITVEYSNLPQMRGGTESQNMTPGAWINWGALWALWNNTGGEEGEEPPTWVKEAYDIDARIMKAVPGSQEAEAAWDDIFEWYYENIPFIVTVDEVVHPMLVVENLKNVPHDGIHIAARYCSEQWYFEE